MTEDVSDIVLPAPWPESWDGVLNPGQYYLLVVDMCYTYTSYR